MADSRGIDRPTPHHVTSRHACSCDRFRHFDTAAAIAASYCLSHGGEIPKREGVEEARIDPVVGITRLDG